MLVLARKLDQSIQIGDDITLTIVAVKGNTVRIGISAPDHVRITRSELQIELPEQRPAQPFKPKTAVEGGEFRSANAVAPLAKRRGGLGLTERAESLRNRRPSDLARSVAAPSDQDSVGSSGHDVVELTTRPDQPVAFRASEDRLNLPGTEYLSHGLVDRRGNTEPLADLYEVQHLRFRIETPNVAETTHR